MHWGVNIHPPHTINKRVLRFLLHWIVLQSFCFFLQNFVCRRRKKIVKVSQFFELTVPNMTPRMYRCYFRMYPHTLFVITEHIAQSQFLQQIDRYIRIPVGKKLAMTCAYIGSSYPTLQLVFMFPNFIFDVIYCSNY